DADYDAIVLNKESMFIAEMYNYFVPKYYTNATLGSWDVAKGSIILSFSVNGYGPDVESVLSEIYDEVSRDLLLTFDGTDIVARREMTVDGEQYLGGPAPPAAPNGDTTIIIAAAAGSVAVVAIVIIVIVVIMMKGKKSKGKVSPSAADLSKLSEDPTPGRSETPVMPFRGDRIVESGDEPVTKDVFKKLTPLPAINTGHTFNSMAPMGTLYDQQEHNDDLDDL
ncbi:unnamed protein product, partial [Owenia fusiformis]